MANKIIISRAFAKELSEHSRQVQKGVNAVYGKLMQPDGMNGLNLETIKGAASSSIKSVRVNDNYRVILHQDKKGNFTFLYVGTHEKAYDWAARNRFEVNAFTGELQLYVVDIPVVRVEAKPDSASVAAQYVEGPFAKNPSDGDLLRLGVPFDQIVLVRSLKDEDDILLHEADFPKGAFEAILMLYDGKTPDEIVQEMALPKTAKGSTDDVFKAVQSSELSQAEFAFASNEEELDEIRKACLAQWRVFLHPSQRRIVTRNANGPVKVLGGAGTGKTVVAMHRVKYLLGTVTGRILFTTYSKNLAEDVGTLLRDLCSEEQMKRVDVVNLDAWAYQYVRASGSAVKCLDEKKAVEIMSCAKGLVDGGDDWTEEFLLRERANVVLANEISSLPGYLRVSRAGQGTRLSAQQKRVVWNILEAFGRELEKEGLKDRDEVMVLAAKLLEKSAGGSPYVSVVADEVQDFGSTALRLLAALSGNTRENPVPNSLMVVGDAHQRIFGKRAILSRCGINVMGRSCKLHINYRTTDKIRRRAVALLEGVKADDLDGAEDNNKGLHSLVLGIAPEEKRFDTFEHEMDAIAAAIRRWHEADNAAGDRRELGDYAVLVQNNDQAASVVSGLVKRGLQAVCLTKYSSQRGKDLACVRVVTMYRAKGLEFAGVIVAELNKGVWPYVPRGFEEMDAVSKKIAIDRERSLLYVALTRAMKHAMIVGVGKAPGELAICDSPSDLGEALRA